MTAIRARPTGAPDGSTAMAPGEEAHQIRPRRGLPGGRAVVGGFLVAVAAVGTFAAVSGAGRDTGTLVVAASRDIAPGTVLEESDLDLLSLDLPDDLAGQVFTSPSQVVGAVATGALAAGELVQAGALADATAAVPTFSLAVPSAAANGGQLRRGDTVQVFATYGADATAITRLLAGAAEVVGVDEGDAELGVTGQVHVLLAIRSAEERSKVINAVTSGAITLVRTTGVPDPEAIPSYRPEGPGGATSVPAEPEG